MGNAKRLTTTELLEAVEISRATLYRWRNHGLVPASLGERRTGVHPTIPSIRQTNIVATYPRSAVAHLVLVRKAIDSGRTLANVAAEFGTKLAKRLPKK
ncbi:MAG: hypothetical protein O7F08_01840 [Deltaproteobacteria bacterium]|nr:hypothetical protein [Deltaproteobacteria bacterium]